MIQEFSESSDVMLTFELPDVPQKASLTLKDKIGQVLLEQEIPAESLNKAISATISKEYNEVLADSGKDFRSVVLSFEIEGKRDKQTQSYILKKEDELIVGTNSFATFGELYLSAMDESDVDALMAAERADQERAMIRAYRNIGLIAVHIPAFVEETEGSTFKMSSFTGSPSKLNELVLSKLSRSKIESLCRAQIIEANFLLGGNPVEHNRRLGLMSSSAGESSQMFRPSKPLELPICRDAATALRGLIVYQFKFLGDTSEPDFEETPHG